MNICAGKTYCQSVRCTISVQVRAKSSLIILHDIVGAIQASIFKLFSFSNFYSSIQPGHKQKQLILAKGGQPTEDIQVIT